MNAMNETHDDMELVNQEGELAEDALYKWDGEEWVQIEHTPFQGYTGEGGRFSSPDDLILDDDDPEETFDDPEPVIVKRQYPGLYGLGQLVPQDVPDDRRVPKYDDTGNVGFLGIVFAVVLIVVVAGLFLWICFGTLG